QTANLWRIKILAQWCRSRHDDPPGFAMLNLTRLHLGIAHESQFQGLGISDLGFVDGQNITIEYRWAASQYDRLSADHDSGVLSIRPLGSTNQYSLVSGLAASRACTHLPW